MGQGNNAHPPLLPGWVLARGYTALLVVVGVLYLWLEWHTTPTLLDDVVYRFQFTASGGMPPVPIHDFGDVLQSQYWHYLSVNGRAPAHVLAQTFLTLVPAHVLDVLNGVLFALLVHLGVGLITPRGKCRVACAVVFAGVIFTVLRGFQGTMLWQLGTFNYLWPLALNFLLLHRLRHSVLTPPSTLHTMAWMGVALLAGWSHEGLSLPVGLGLLTALAVCPRPQRHRRVVAIVAVYIVGMALCMASPGIWHRAGDAPTLVSRVVNGCVAVATNVRVLWVLLLTVVVLWHQGRIGKTAVVRALPIVVTLCASYGLVFASGVTLDRVAFHAEMLSLVVLLSLWWHFAGPLRLRALCFVTAAVSLPLYVAAVPMLRQQVACYRYAVAQMARSGVQLVATRDVRPANRLERIAASRYVMPFAEYGFYCCYMGFDAEDSNMQCAASLYGKSRLRFLPEDMVHRMRSDARAFSRFAPDAGHRLLAKRLEGHQKVHGVEFVLRPESPDSLHVWQRVVAYQGDCYALDDFHWEVLSVAGRRYLVCTQPVTAVSRRIARIEIK